MIGVESLVEQVLNSKALPLVSIKCSPYHYKDKAVILGDAAHAMVPFYGQGMNAGMEDCIVLDEMLELHHGHLEDALKAYSEHRVVDDHAICDLAMYNYVEMRAHVNSKLFLMRKLLDNFLHGLFGDKWVPLYTSVSFRRIRYHDCVDNKAWQDSVINGVFRKASYSAAFLTTATLFWYIGRRDVKLNGFWENFGQIRMPFR